MSNNYVYVATINGLPVAARRRKYDLLRTLEGVMRHSIDDVRVLRMADRDNSKLVDMTEDLRDLSPATA